jgi:AcrR family transcriptional regulator
MRADDQHPTSPDGRPATSARGGSLAPATPRGEATKRRILDAAEAVFGEQGYYEASVSEITRRAGVAQGTFYIYFHTKREIFIELIEDMGRRLRAALGSAIAEAPNRLEAERRGFAAFFQFVAEHRRIYRIIQEAERVAPEAAHDYYRRISSGYQRALRSAMNVGEVRPLQPEAIAYALMGIGHFLALRWLIWPDEEGQAAAPQIPQDVFDAALRFITHGLAAREEGSGST